MSELPDIPGATHGMPARSRGRSAEPVSTVRTLRLESRQNLDPALRARLSYLAWRRFEIRATDVDDIVQASLEAYRRTTPRRGFEPERSDLLVEIFRRECGRFLERLARLGRETSDCYRNPKPRGMGPDARSGRDDVARADESSRLPAVTRTRALWVLLEIRSPAHDVRSGPSSPDGRGRIGDPDRGVPPFVRRRRTRGFSLRVILTRNGRVR